MRKFLKVAAKGLKISLYLGVFTVSSSLLYLQYINSQIGKIDIDPDITAKHYIQKYNIPQKQAKNMCYWLYYDIAFMRVLTYYNFSSYCQKLNNKIINKALNNYEKDNVIQQIQTLNQANPQNVSQNVKIYGKVMDIRKQNFQNMQDYEYIIKQIRKQQKIMDTRAIIGFPEQQQKKLQTVYNFLLKTGQKYKNKEILKYLEEITQYQQAFPGDFVHKIIMI